MTSLEQETQRPTEEVFNDIVEEYSTFAFNVAYRMLRKVEDAEDAVQEAFINIWRRAGSFSTARGTARTWIMAVVHHRSIDIGRKRRGIAPRELPLELERLPEDASDTWSEVANTMDGEMLRRCLKMIPDDQREAIELAYFEGYTQREISEAKGIPLGTVKGRIRIGMAKLRGMLHEMGLGGSTDEP